LPASPEAGSSEDLPAGPSPPSNQWLAGVHEGFPDWSALEAEAHRVGHQATLCRVAWEPEKRKAFIRILLRYYQL